MTEQQLDGVNVQLGLDAACGEPVPQIVRRPRLAPVARHAIEATPVDQEGVVLGH